MALDWSRWIRGPRAGVEVLPGALRVAVMRGQSLRAEKTFPLGGRPSAEWGAEVNEFLKASGAANEPLVVVLPDEECVTRVVALPGVAAKDQAAALALQMDSLYPFPGQEPAAAWVPISGTTSMLVGLTRPEVIRRWTTLMAEAGLQLAGCTIPAVVIPRQRRPMMAVSGSLVYAESGAIPMLWASNVPLPLVRAQLRLPDETEAESLDALLPGGSLASAAAAGPLRLNLLPADQRAVHSRWGWVSTAVLASLAGLGIALLLAFPAIERERLLALLRAETARLEPAAQRSAAALRANDQARGQAEELVKFRERTRTDLTALREATRLLPAPGWATQLDLTRTNLNLAGESPQAAELLRAFDGSPYFKNTEFTSPLGRSQTPGADVFRLRSERREPAPAPPVAPGQPKPAVPAAGAKELGR
ncbi:MAG: PilN domain-containing protein [Acidobacteria bacterium]|nr:PilN domain-containing protein [Acidobacteriota bacterium]